MGVALERSKFHRNQYIAYAHGVWRVYRRGRTGYWTAWPTQGQNKGMRIEGLTIKDVTSKLAKWEANRVWREGGEHA